MQVQLIILTGPEQGRMLPVRSGESICVGRTEASDIPLPDDPQLSSRHFQVTVDGTGCRIQDLQSTNGTFVNGQRCDESRLSDGDEIKAGTTRFTVSIEVEANLQATTAPQESASPPPPQPVPSASPPAPPPSPPAPTIPTAAAPVAVVVSTGMPVTAELVCQRVELDPEATELLEDEDRPRKFLERLVAEEKLPDAVRFWAQALPCREAVSWACLCVRKADTSLTETDQAALEAAESWVLDPSEEHRRQAEATAKATEFQTPAGWAALAAFWSSGSLGPTDMPEVPPDQLLTGNGVAAAVMLAATSGPAEQVNDRYREFLDAGMQLAETLES